MIASSLFPQSQNLLHSLRSPQSLCAPTALLLACGALLATPCHAADPNASAALPAVVVTATRQAQAPFDVPASVDAVGADLLQTNTLGINLAESFGSVPGVLARDRQDFAQDAQLSIRGFGASAPFGIVGVRLFADGVPASFPDGQGQATHFNLDSADRIEVLRGPFSALYGNASGGVIEIFTADGPANPQMSSEAMGGSYGTYRTSANARGQAGNIGYNIDYTHFATDGYREHSRAQRDSGNGKWTFDLGDNKVTLVANTLSAPEAQDDGGINYDEFEADPRQADSSALIYNTRKSTAQSQAGLIDEWTFAKDQTLRVMGYGGDRIVKQYLATPVSAEGSPTSAGGVVDLHSAYAGTDLRYATHGMLLQGPWSFVAGASYDLENQHRRGYNNFLDSADPATYGQQGLLRRDEQDRLYDLDEYLQGSWQFTQHWSALIGARHDEVHFKTEDHYIVLPSNPDDSGQQAYYATTPVAGLMFKALPTLHLYASYGEGFDTPTFDQTAYRPDGGSGVNFALQPARSGNGELGEKWEFSEGSFANLAVFRSMTRDEIVVASASGGRSTYTNAGRVRRQGVEAEVSAALVGAWRWNLAYTYLDSTQREAYETCASNRCPTANVQVQTGNRLPGAPQNAVYSALQYSDADHAGWNARLEGSYYGQVQVNDANTTPTPDYGLLGANAGYVWIFSHYSIEAFARVDNMLYTHYVGAVVVDDANSRYYEPGAGRSAYGGIDLRWKP